jgi:hypothetical protein
LYSLKISEQYDPTILTLVSLVLSGASISAIVLTYIFQGGNHHVESLMHFIFQANTCNFLSSIILTAGHDCINFARGQAPNGGGGSSSLKHRESEATSCKTVPQIDDTHLDICVYRRQVSYGHPYIFYFFCYMCDPWCGNLPSGPTMFCNLFGRVYSFGEILIVMFDQNLCNRLLYKRLFFLYNR